MSKKQSIVIIAVCLLVGSVIFLVAYFGMKYDSGIGALNQPVLTWMLEHREPSVVLLAKIVTNIASPIIFTAIVLTTAMIWAVINREIWRPFMLVSSAGVAAAAFILLKAITMDSRPLQEYMVPTFETNYSFPSGHTVSMIVFMLMFGYAIYSRRYSARSMIFWILAALIGSGIIASTRLYLGYHWLTDVVASVGLGFMILAIFITLDQLVIRHAKP